MSLNFHILRPTLPAIEAGFIPAEKRFGDYLRGEVWEQSLRNMSVNPETFFVPAVRFILDATIGIAGHPDVQEQLDPEIEIRRNQLAKLSDAIVSIARNNGVFQDVYHFTTEQGNPVLDAYFKVLEEDQVLERLGKAPYFEAGIVGGGALNYCRVRGIENAKEKIAASADLKIVGRISKDLVRDTLEGLGLPYTHEQHFTWNEDTEELEFKDPAKQQIQSSFGSGCPSALITTPKNGPRLFDVYWAKILDVLITPDAEVNHYEPLTF